jgi:hypothetical protein
MRWAGYVAYVGEKKNTCKILVGNTEGRPRLRWQNNIKMYLI